MAASLENTRHAGSSVVGGAAGFVVEMVVVVADEGRREEVEVGAGAVIRVVAVVASETERVDCDGGLRGRAAGVVVGKFHDR